MEKKKNSKKKNNKKTTVKKNYTVKKNSTVKKNTTPKKNNGTKQVQNKPTPKKEKVKKVEPKVEPKVEKVEEEKKLEKTIIFDGKQNKNLKEVVEKLEEENIVLEDKVVKRSKSKKYAIIVIAIMMVVIAAASSAYVISRVDMNRKNNQTTGSNIYEKVSNNEKKKDEKIEDANVKEIDDVEDYSNIKTITLAQFEKKVLDHEDMYVLVASSTCYGCITFEPVVNEVFEEMDKTIYRIDVVKLSHDDLKQFRTYYAFSVTPTIFILKNGVVVADTATTGSMPKEDLIEWVSRNS